MAEVDDVATVEQWLAACDPDRLSGLDPRALVELARSLFDVCSRLEAARLRVIDAVARAGAFRTDGARDMAAWLAGETGERRGAARRDVEVASAVAAMPAVGAGLDAGSLTKAKAVELARMVDAPAEDQAMLVAAAARLTPEQLARRVDRWHLEHAPVDVQPAVRFTPVAGGGRVDAVLDAEGFEWVQVAIDAAAGQIEGAESTWMERRARGLVGVCRYFLGHADLPQTRVGRPTVVVTVDVETLAAATGGSARLASGAYVGGDVARRMACDAGVVRIITGPESQPLDVGRRRRTPTEAQCRAVIHRDEHCRFEACTAPPWACEVHHLDHWAHGGRTDLGRLALLCWYHHTLIHRSAQELFERHDGRLQLRPRLCSDAA